MISPLQKSIFCFLLLTVTVQAFWSRPADRGARLFAKGEYEAALAAYMEARAEDPKSPIVAYGMGTVLYKLGRHAEAREELREALRATDPKLARNVAYNLAAVEFRLGEGEKEPKDRIARWREAIALLKRSLDSDPSHEKSKRNVEIIQRKLKEELDKLKEQQKDQNQQKPEPDPREKEWRAILARALQLARQSLYPEAKNLLDATINSVPESKSLLGGPAQRIQDVIDIGEGRAPAPLPPPAGTGNITDELGVI